MTSILTPPIVTTTKTVPAFRQEDHVMVGSCNIRCEPGSLWISLGSAEMQNPPNPNSNPKCGKLATVTFDGGLPLNLTITDTCDDCGHNGYAVSVSGAAAKALGPKFMALDRPDITYSINN
ncbi:hypothetical protein IWQ60_012462 [Tieghemiomyces parasiticus]|uniref:RlpA-like protein double-psi beta-barrel domain-containing protein n=1 Tax=Tieghemiomyces parasiticus TaxID=78921 RepID=A0A9W7ZHX9_9FUNG|nr:hypothetical protein IWQ60_012462 [Tieghemiomyces parasiticus]